MTDMNLPIASKGFALLVLDHEWKGCPELKLDSGCYCRILIDGWYRGSLIAENRKQAIDKFLAGNWR